MAADASAPPWWQGLLSGVLDLAGEYVSKGVRISIKTNFGPELPVATAALGNSGGAGGGGSRGAGIAGLLGFKAAVIVRDAQGETIATYGDPPKTEVWRALLAVAVVGGLAFLVIRGAVK